MFRKILIANRGEIALRILRACRELGIRSVITYSEADRNSLPVLLADEAVCIGPAASVRSYNSISAIISAATVTGCDALHPGYGFLAENASLAEICRDCGITFIGPRPEVMQEMSDKATARRIMHRHGLPIVPGTETPVHDAQRAVEAAEEIGYPIVIKAIAGGGGRGMRVANDERELMRLLPLAQSEALTAFGDRGVYLERFLDKPRHIEVQVLGDAHGRVLSLGERDCSLQRRYQKLVEESPAPNITKKLRDNLAKAAVRGARAIDYTGAGTMEFLIDEQGRHFFTEMNTRIQVEHPVTEMVTGLDLVEWQIRIANGEPLPWNQEDLPCQGHAMEARVYAEDPDNGFLPQTGRLHTLQEPTESETVRVDSGVRQGVEITPWYDPMLAKVIAVGADRQEARLNLIEALNRYHTDGVILNTDYVSRVLRHDDFAAARLTTRFVEIHEEDLARPLFTPWARKRLSLVAWLDEVGALTHCDSRDVWGRLSGFRTGDSHWQPFELDLDGDRHHGHYQVLRVGKVYGQLTVLMDDEVTRVRWRRMDDDALEVRLSGRRIRLDGAARGDELAVFADAATWKVRVNHPEVAQGAAADETELTAPMHGRVTAILCKAGETVKAGQALLTMEAMKMEHTLKAGFDGTVEAVHCQADSNVEAAQVLITLDKPED